MNINHIYTIIIGFAAGLLGSALGQTGSGIMIPFLLMLGIVPDFKTAAGTVLLAILPPVSILGIFEYYKNGQVYVNTSIILMCSYFFASYIGVLFTKNIPNSHMEYATSIYFFSIGLFFLWNGYTGYFGSKTKAPTKKLI